MGSRAPALRRDLTYSQEQHRLGTCGTLLRTFSDVLVTTVSATEARRRLYALIDEVGQSHQPRGACSRRINIQHRLVYQVLEDVRLVKVLRMWSHYGV